MVQLPHGRASIFSSLGSAYMMYNNVMKPGASIVIQAILPGIFRRDSMEVLPCGYQSSSHCDAVICPAARS